MDAQRAVDGGANGARRKEIAAELGVRSSEELGGLLVAEHGGQLAVRAATPQILKSEMPGGRSSYGITQDLLRDLQARTDYGHHSLSVAP